MYCRTLSGFSPHTISIPPVSSSSSSSSSVICSCSCSCSCSCVPNLHRKEYFSFSTESEKPPQRPRHHHLLLFCSPNSNGNDDEAVDVSDVQMHSATVHDHDGSKISSTTTQPEKPFTSNNELIQRLRRYGISGVLSYGLLNTVYYLSTFLLVWFYIAPAPGRMGYAAAVERFLKVMAMVWAGSQVTKLFRAAGALALAPFVDRGLSWFTVKLNFDSHWKAFMTIVGFCFGLALLLFFGVTLLWA